jgi:hypothetical protein
MTIWRKKMPLSEVAKGSYEQTLSAAKAATYEPLAMMHFGYCQGLVGQSLFCNDLTFEEHHALSAEITGAIKEWDKQNNNRKPRA